MEDEVDPFEARLTFLGLLSRLNASQNSIHKVSGYAMRNRHLADDLYSCIFEELEQASINSRLNILYVFDALCSAAQKYNFTAYIDCIRRDLPRILKLVVPDDQKGSVNLLSTRKILDHWRACKIFPEEEIEKAEKPLLSREVAYVRASASEDDFSKDDILRRMEEDRERHKKLRENIWIRPSDESPAEEFEQLWQLTGPLSAADEEIIMAENSKYLHGYDWPAYLTLDILDSTPSPQQPQDSTGPKDHREEATIAAKRQLNEDENENGSKRQRLADESQVDTGKAVRDAGIGNGNANTLQLSPNIQEAETAVDGKEQPPYNETQKMTASEDEDKEAASTVGQTRISPEHAKFRLLNPVVGRKIVIWNLDETLIVYNALYDGDYEDLDIAKHGKQGKAIAREMKVLGKEMEYIIFAVIDSHFAFAKFEENDQPHTNALEGAVNYAELNNTDRACKLLELAKLLQAKRTLYDTPGALEELLSDPEKARIANIYKDIDDLTEGYLRFARSLVEKSSRSDNINVLVTAGHLIPTLAKCFIFRLQDLFPSDRIWSSHLYGKEWCFEKIQSCYGQGNTFIAIGDGDEEEDAANHIGAAFELIEGRKSLAALYHRLFDQ